MRCIVVSLHRSGTNSLTKLLNDFSIRTIHWPRVFNGDALEQQVVGKETDLKFVVDTIAPVFTTCDALSDVPIPVLYEQLQRRHPEAKFILLFRNPFDWIRSIRGHIGTRNLDPFERVQYWHYLNAHPESLQEVSNEELFSMYCRHSFEVADFFHRVAPEKLGIFHLYDPNVGYAIAEFLDVKTSQKLPHLGHGRRPGLLGGLVHRLRYFGHQSDRRIP